MKNSDAIIGAYDLAKRIRDGSLTRTAGIEDLHQRFGMNRSSARGAFTNIAHMLKGEPYKRTMNALETDHFLQMIHRDYGTDGLSKAIASVEKHIRYYEGLPRGSKLVNIWEIVHKYRNIAKDQREPVATGLWLYPISAGADRSFVLADGQSIPVSVDSYRGLLENGRIVEDLYWYISQNWNNVEIGDELFIYTGDDDLGIIGYGTVVGIEKRGDRWCILPRFDLGRSRALLNHPVAAAVVRDWVAFPRKSVINLTPFQEKLRAHLPWAGRDAISDSVLPEEINRPTGLVEGAVRSITVNAYERSPEARQRCIEAHGTTCCICEFSFLAKYGELAEGYIHVHHLRPLSEISGEYVVDPVMDLRPVCPNCHAVLHLGGQCRSIDEVRHMVERNQA